MRRPLVLAAAVLLSACGRPVARWEATAGQDALLGLDSADNVLRRVPMAGDVQCVLPFPVDGFEERGLFVVLTGRQHLRGGADRASVVGIDASGQRVFRFPMPEETPFLREDGEPHRQVNGLPKGLSEVRDLPLGKCLLCVTGGTWSPSLVLALKGRRPLSEGDQPVEEILRFWNAGSVNPQRAWKGDSVVLSVFFNRLHDGRYATNLPQGLVRLDLRAGPGTEPGVCPAVKEGHLAGGRGFAWYLALPNLRPGPEPSPTVRVGWEGETVSWEVKPARMVSTLTVLLDSEGRLKDLVYPPAAAEEYERTRLPGQEPPFEKWLEGLREACARFRALPGD